MAAGTVYRQYHDHNKAGRAKLNQEQEEDKWPWIRELIAVLVYYEILKDEIKEKYYLLEARHRCSAVSDQVITAILRIACNCSNIGIYSES